MVWDILSHGCAAETERLLDERGAPPLFDIPMEKYIFCPDCVARINEFFNENSLFCQTFCFIMNFFGEIIQLSAGGPHRNQETPHRSLQPNWKGRGARSSADFEGSKLPEMN